MRKQQLKRKIYPQFFHYFSILPRQQRKAPCVCSVPITLVKKPVLMTCSALDSGFGITVAVVGFKLGSWWLSLQNVSFLLSMLEVDGSPKPDKPGYLGESLQSQLPALENSLNTKRICDKAQRFCPRTEALLQAPFSSSLWGFSCLYLILPAHYHPNLMAVGMGFKTSTYWHGKSF